MTNDLQNQAGLQPEDVRRLCGEILDWKVGAIVASGASLSDVEIAVAWLTGADEAIGETPLEGKAALVYDMLVGGEDFLGDQEAGVPSRGA